MPADIEHEDDPVLARVARKTTPAAALAALGIVYGDLGTSPLYTLQAVVSATGGHFSPEAALGSLSLIFWALIITISVKYCLFVMRADNHGEGGILALMSMTGANWSEGRRILIVMGLFGAALIYGDGIITPAISVLSALEGLNVATDVFKPHVVLMAVAILFALFAIQSRGTAQIAKAFGPVMLLWFAVIAALGVVGISRYPAVIAAVDPRYGIALLTGHGWSGIAVLGGVFLAMTGGEAMYADMGHIGRNPIRTSWYGIVLPALLLNYAGQVALFLGDPAMDGNPFFRLAPSWSIYPLVGLATDCHDHRQPGDHHRIVFADPSGDAARLVPGRADPPDLLGGIRADLRTVRELDDDGADGCAHCQLRQFGSPGGRLWHRGFDHHAADDRAALQCHAHALALAGRTGADRERAVSRCRFRVLRGQSVQDPGGRLDPAYVRHAGVHRHGLMALRLRGHAPPPHGVDGDAGGVLPPPQGEPRPARARHGHLSDAVRYYDAVPDRRARRADESDVRDRDRADGEISRISRASHRATASSWRSSPKGFWHITVHFGFVQVPDIPAALRQAKDRGCPIDLEDAIYFGARDAVVCSKRRSWLVRASLRLFTLMFRNSVRAVDLFNIPPEKFVEVGRQIEI